MEHILNHEKAHQKYFEEMTAIPHGSYHEQAYSAYLVAFAKEHGLKWIQDELYNVIIYKDASAGYEDHAPVLLQAHTDMVCEKNKDTDFDFEKDALKLYIEDGFLKARGTTLGQMTASVLPICWLCSAIRMQSTRLWNACLQYRKRWDSLVPWH